MKNKNLMKKISVYFVASTIAVSGFIPLSSQTNFASASNEVVVVNSNSRIDFIESIANYSIQLARGNDLYPSVMIAQALLESGSGNSSLASAPNYNLFGIKAGTGYTGEVVSKTTNEDDGTGNMYQIIDAFRKYNSHKESLEDYAKFFNRTTWHKNYYHDVFRSNTINYQDATAALTGTYATDTKYGEKLNKLIEQYNLTKYDGNSYVKTTEIYYIVKSGDTLSKIANAYNTTYPKIQELNELETTNIKVGQKLLVGVEKTTVYVDEPNVIVNEPAKPIETTKPVETSKEEPAKTSVTNKTYTVVKGDTLYGVSKKLNVTVDQLKKWNKLSSTTIKVGQALKYETAKVVSSPAMKETNTTKPVVNTTTKTGTVTASLLNIRSSASATSKIVGTLKKGTKVTITSTTGKWAYITYSGKKGYVSTDYLKVVVSGTTVSSNVSKPIVKATVSSTKKQATVTASLLNMRNSASVTSKIVGTLKKGTKVTITNTTGKWAYITYGGKKGYVSTDYLKTITNTIKPAAKIVTVSTKTYTVKKGDTLWSVSSKNNVSVSKIKSLNNLKSNTIYVGQKLHVK